MTNEQITGVHMKSIILVFMLFVLSSCSTMHIVKECNPVENTDDLFVCKNLKPWE